MAEYELRFWFEHGGFCVWGMNEKAKNKFGYPIRNEKLPISEELKNELNALEIRYHGCLDWESPLNPSPWSREEKEQFRADANSAYVRLKEELGEDYHVIDMIDDCIYE